MAAMLPDDVVLPVPALILASASPRRRELLHDAGYSFEVAPSDVDEDQETPTAGPAELAERLSALKASAVARGLARGIVLGADTVVSAAGVLYAKARDADDARRILGVLTHTPHEVITGVTLVDAATHRRETAHAVTRVHMTPMTPTQLEAYIASGLWEGKAGAYGIQDHDDAFVQRLEGSFTNVVGLPMELVTRMLTEWGIRPGPRPAD